MNLESPSTLTKNKEQFFGTNDSPDSPCLISKNVFNKTRRAHKRPAPLATKNLNSLIDLLDTAYSPTSTLAADLSENFHIDHEIDQQYKPVSKRPAFFARMEQSARPSLPSHSSRSSRTGSNTSISSVCSLSSFSSVESISSVSTVALQAPFQQSSQLKGVNPSRKTLRRAQTASTTTINTKGLKSIYALNCSETFTGSSSIVSLDQDSDAETDSLLDRLCVPSPIMERTLVLEENEENEDINKREVGSPIQKKPIRSKVRRIHSMFYSKKEITDTTNMFENLMNSKSPDLDRISSAPYNDSDGCLSNSMLKKSKIEVFHAENDSIPRINVQTLCSILDGQYKDFFDEVTIVDCRFEYEYQGGHIDGAVNVSSQRELEERFLDRSKMSKSFQTKKNRLIVFHCEFSSYRGPLMASHLRTCDRNINQDNYPHLDYPDILILEGGYKTFFDSETHRCNPRKYVEMNDDNHKKLCEQELTRFKRDLKKASSFNNLSFAASINSSSTSISSACSTFTSTKLHKRTLTSGAINFSRRQSFKSQSLDFSRNSIDESISESDDQNKPPASLNFAFKFPKPVDPNLDSSATNSSIGNSLSSRFVLPSQPHNDTPIVRKKLSRSFTTNL